MDAPAASGSIAVKRQHRNAPYFEPQSQSYNPAPNANPATAWHRQPKPQ